MQEDFRLEAAATRSATHQVVEYRKDGGLSRMRLHKGNIPVLPQTKFCPHCPAKFTRTTHLNRHMHTHTGERLHHCDTCHARFTRSDLLTRHKKTCRDPARLRWDCEACAESKINCDLEYPCGGCQTRGKPCVFPVYSGRRTSSGSTAHASPQTSVSTTETPRTSQRNLSRASSGRALNRHPPGRLIDTLEAQNHHSALSSVSSEYVSSSVSSDVISTAFSPMTCSSHFFLMSSLGFNMTP
ncbi:hypothetical protein K503DRAFT_38273 [Rhizopogon vinicolor AM-OR11-026]|uniref:C2H2-type domain-containing protein n=1 Tax=Rhizopogon vinicolor AM-OR11-026 TaxID=1314800 RepID=A0A1B7N564_9AGAM|nr:hypothetical protein K503DRAFT_38273 [Rhizopogon vinicolor AM-OR11-026]